MGVMAGLLKSLLKVYIAKVRILLEFQLNEIVLHCVINWISLLVQLSDRFQVEALHRLLNQKNQKKQQKVLDY